MPSGARNQPAMSSEQDPRDAWTVYDPERENSFHYDSSADAKDKIGEAKAEFGVDAKLYPPGDLPSDEDAEPADPEVTDPKPVEAPKQDAEFQPASTLATEPDDGAALQPVDPSGTVEMYEQYEQLKADLLDSDDYQNGNFIKKSGWRKIATAFNVDVDVAETEREQANGVIRYRVEAVATAPNGKTARALGMAESSESNFMDTVDYDDVQGREDELADESDVFKVDGKYRRLRDPRAVKEHNVLTLAATRGKNRAISDLVGGGEVSAEEVR